MLAEQNWDIVARLHAEPRLLAAVRGLVRGFAENAGFPEERADEVVLAVDEACSNSIRHAYAGQPGAVLELALRCTSEYIEFELKDEGFPAPKECLECKESPPPDATTVQPGGLGISLMRRVFDEVRFDSGAERGNHIIMRLRRPAASPEIHGEEGKGLIQ